MRLLSTLRDFHCFASDRLRHVLPLFQRDVPLGYNQFVSDAELEKLILTLFKYYLDCLIKNPVSVIG